MAKAEIARLTSILKTLRRGRFGKSSEKLGADDAEQQSFVFEEVETGLEEINARLAARSAGKPRKTPRDRPRFPSHLERVEEVVEPEIPEAFEGKERVKIGQEESVRLDGVRARFRLVVTIRPKYAYKEPAAIPHAPAPEHIVEAGLPTEARLAQMDGRGRIPLRTTRRSCARAHPGGRADIRRRNDAANPRPRRGQDQDRLVVGLRA